MRRHRPYRQATHACACASTQESPWAHGPRSMRVPVRPPTLYVKVDDGVVEELLHLEAFKVLGGDHHGAARTLRRELAAHALERVGAPASGQGCSGLVPAAANIGQTNSAEQSASSEASTEPCARLLTLNASPGRRCRHAPGRRGGSAAAAVASCLARFAAPSPLASSSLLYTTIGCSCSSLQAKRKQRGGVRAAGGSGWRHPPPPGAQCACTLSAQHCDAARLFLVLCVLRLPTRLVLQHKTKPLLRAL